MSREPKPPSIDFWERVYIAALSHGSSYDAVQLADQAIEDWLCRHQKDYTPRGQVYGERPPYPVHVAQTTPGFTRVVGADFAEVAKSRNAAMGLEDDSDD